MKRYRIDLKGRMPEHYRDEILNKGFSDVSFGYSNVVIQCTEEELSETLKTMSKDETWCKVIGVQEI